MAEEVAEGASRTRGALKIVGLGDSTTAGTPGFRSPVESPPDGRGNPESQYAFWMRRLHPEWTVLNRGVNGERTDEILRRLPRDALEERPDYVIVLAGVNDVYQGRVVAAIESNLDLLFRETVGRHSRVLAATILPFNSMSRVHATAIRALNRWIRERASALGQLYCDTNALVADPDDPGRLAGSPDGLHPDVPTYRKMGEGLTATIEAAERVQKLV